MCTHSTHRSTVRLQDLSALLDSLVLHRKCSYQCMEGLPVCSSSSSSKGRLPTCLCPWARVILADLLSIHYNKVCRRWCRRWASSQCMEELQTQHLRHPVSTSQSMEDPRSHSLHKPDLLPEATRHLSTASKQPERTHKPSPCTSAARTFHTTTSRIATKGSVTCGCKKSWT